MVHVSLNQKLQENKEPSGDLVGGRLRFLVKCTINTEKTTKSVSAAKGGKVCWAFCLIISVCFGFLKNNLLFIIR